MGTVGISSHAWHLHCTFIVGHSQTSSLCRLRSNVPAVGRVTFTASEERKQTSLTLQDGCFGAGTLMRIAALCEDPDSDADSVANEEPDQAHLQPSVAPEEATGGAGSEHEASSSFASAARTAGSPSVRQDTPQERQSGYSKGMILH